jgi:hypothetical protein
MAQINKDVLKKHHFWIIAGLIPVLILVAVILIWTGAGSAVAAGEADIKKAIDGAKSRQPSGKWVLGKLDENKNVVASKKDKLWEYNWNEQKTLFTWPQDANGKLAKFLLDPKDPNYTKDPQKAQILKFGSPLPNDNFQFQAFTDQSVYLKAYETEAKAVEPTQFLGGSWRSVLRVIPNWTEKLPESWMIWLALEDLWVQRGVLEPIRAVTQQAAAFDPIDEKGADGKPVPPGLKRSFASRLWQLDLEVKTEGPRRYMTGKIKNLTDRVQLLGIGNIMKLNVYFDNQTVPFDFRVEGEYVEAGKSRDIMYVPVFHDLPPELNPTSITRVTQEFDARTVPVKRIDRIVLGKTDNRHFAGTLKAPAFVPVPEVVAPTGGDGDAAGGGRGMVMGAPGTGSPDGGMGGPGSTMGGMMGTASGLEGAFAPLKVRYLETTEQVRRMPVAIVLIVDSMYLQDVLAAYSNAKLRFQVTQIHYRRFRDKLALPGASGSGFPGSMGGSAFGGGNEIMSGGFGFEGEDSSMGGGGRGFGGGSLSPRGVPGGPGGGVGSPDGGDPRGGGFGAPPMGMMGGPRGPGGPTGPGGFGGPPMGYGGMMGGYGGMLSTGVAESQTAAGLIEVSIYGIVSLYDRFGEIPAADATPAEPAAPATPAPAAPANPNNPAAPAPTPPMGTPSNPMKPGDENKPKPDDQ